ncbi:Uncharacterized protein FWK35_00036846, partial [Aphis craccivora]
QLQPIPLSNKPLDRLTFDYLGPLIPTTTQSTINFIIQIISQWGCFRQFSSDRGTHFKNQMVSEVCENLGIKQILLTSYSPQTQGFVEKINDYLPYFTLSYKYYNATPQTSTKYSPFYLMHDFEPCLIFPN